ncbi:MAG: cytochrome b/b6 domain-containing protein [Pseudomonadales bacterium]
MSSAQTDPTLVLVWDWPLRAFHWLLTLSICGSWLTAELGVEYTEWHMRLGYFTIGLLAFRMFWGVLGSRYARFAAWRPRPFAAFAYLKTLFDRQAPRMVGHNPLGALAVWALLILVAVQALSGLFVDDDILFVGPYQPAVSSRLSEQLTDLHHANFDWLLLALAVHLLAIAFYGFYKRQNLVAPMVTGRAPVDQASASALSAPAPAWWKPLLAIGLSIALIALLLTLAPEPVYDDYF